MTTGYKYIKNDVSQWSVSSGTFVNGGTFPNDYIQCNVAGLMSLPSIQAYGEWYFDIIRANDGVTFNIFLNGNESGFTTNCYKINVSTGNALFAYIGTISGNTSTLMSTANNYVLKNIKYSYKINRTTNGVFTIYIRGGIYGSTWNAVTATTGTNPFTNTTITTSNFFGIYLRAGDKISNVRFKNYVNSFSTIVYSQNNLWDVYVIAGQSNASGYEPMANLQSDYQGTYDKTYIWNGTALVALNASVSNNNQYPASAKNSRFGWDMAMSKYLNNSGRNVILIKYAINSTGLEEHWGSGDSLLTDSLMKYLNLCKTYLTANYYSYRFRGLLWYQGEKDMQQLSGSTNYESNLGKLITNIRANTIYNLPVYILRPACCSGYTYYNQVRTAMSDYTTSDANSYLFDLDGIYSTLHQNAAEYEQTGIMVSTKLLNDL